MIRRFLALIGLLFLALLLLSFLAPAIEYANARQEVATAEADFQDAERDANQAGREREATKAAGSRGEEFQQAIATARTRLDAWHKAQERLRAAQKRLQGRLGKWFAVFTD
jgi:hypothetical protein